MIPDADAVVVGAGPSGAATALLLARAGHRVTVVDRARFPRDKACGEGLMPPGVGVLARLGLLEEVRATGAPELRSVSYRLLEGGPVASAEFPEPPLPGSGPGGSLDEPPGRTPGIAVSSAPDHPGGDVSPTSHRQPGPARGARWALGVRRLRFDAVLVSALRADPRVELIQGFAATGLHRNGLGRVDAVLRDGDAIAGRVVVAADGLHSRVRAAAGWTTGPPGLARYGLAGHWRVETGGIDGIAVRFAGDHEWYQAPVGPDELLVSVLGTRERIGALARDYPGEARATLPVLRGAQCLGGPLAAGRFAQSPPRISGGGLFLVGDAAGYDDPITGDGIATGLLGAEILAGHVDALLRERVPAAVAEASYARDHARLLRDRRRVTRIALHMARHPTTARRAVAAAARRPRVMELLLGVNCGYWGLGGLGPRDWLALAGI